MIIALSIVCILLVVLALYQKVIIKRLNEELDKQIKLAHDLSMKNSGLKRENDNLTAENLAVHNIVKEQEELIAKLREKLEPTKKIKQAKAKKEEKVVEEKPKKTRTRKTTKK